MQTRHFLFITDHTLIFQRYSEPVCLLCANWKVSAQEIIKMPPICDAQDMTLYVHFYFLAKNTAHAVLVFYMNKGRPITHHPDLHALQHELKAKTAHKWWNWEVNFILTWNKHQLQKKIPCNIFCAHFCDWMQSAGSAGCSQSSFSLVSSHRPPPQSRSIMSWYCKTEKETA